MKILVAVKRVIDSSQIPRVRADGTGIETTNVKMGMNPYDEVAVEAAVRLKQAGLATEVVVVSIGEAAAAETIRSGLAMGADRGILVTTDAAPEPLGVARILQRIVAEEQAALVILGKQAIDGDCGQTGQMLAGKLGWGQATSVSQLEIAGNLVTAGCEVDAGRQSVELSLPAVVTVDLRLNQPRHPNLAGIKAGKQMPIDLRSAADLAIDLRPRLTVLKTYESSSLRAGVRIATVGELVAKLKADLAAL